MNRFKGKKFLIVDDDKDILSTLKENLELYGAQCETATDGLIAFELIKNRNYDVIISDVRMPNASGIELLDMIQKYEKKAPRFIMMSAFTDLTVEGVKRLGAQGLYLKPHNLEVLLDLLD